MIVWTFFGVALAQDGAVYPDVASVRTSLQALVAAHHDGFAGAAGGLLEEKSTVRYYAANLHMVPGDTPKIAVDTNPAQYYYIDFLAKRMTEEQSRVAFQKWQELILAALPDRQMTVDGNQYPDLESRKFTSPDGSGAFVLYRNGSGTECQVSISVKQYGTPTWTSAPPSVTKSVADNTAPSGAQGATNASRPAVALPPSSGAFCADLERIVDAGHRSRFEAIKGERTDGGRSSARHRPTVGVAGATAVSLTIPNGTGTIERPAYEAEFTREATRGALTDASLARLSRDVTACLTPAKGWPAPITDPFDDGNDDGSQGLYLRHSAGDAWPTVTVDVTHAYEGNAVYLRVAR